MKNFKQFLTEKWLNLFTPEEKAQYVDEVWEVLQNSYAYAGGIKGNGFNSKQDMIDNIPMWKLNRKDGQIISVSMYKDKDGRKLVASGVRQDNGKSIRSGVKASSKSRMDEFDFKRSYFEVSDKALNHIKKMLGDSFLDHAIPVSIVKKKMPDDEIIPVDDYYYKRKIGGEWITKIMLGNPNAPRITVKV